VKNSEKGGQVISVACFAGGTYWGRGGVREYVATGCWGGRGVGDQKKQEGHRAGSMAEGGTRSGVESNSKRLKRPVQGKCVEMGLTTFIAGASKAWSF